MLLFYELLPPQRRKKNSSRFTITDPMITSILKSLESFIRRISEAYNPDAPNNPQNDFRGVSIVMGIKVHGAGRIRPQLLMTWMKAFG